MSPRSPLLAIVALCAVGSCSLDRTTTAGPSATVGRAVRPAVATTCQRLSVEMPTDFVLVDRSLPNLGDGLFGRIEVYDDVGRRLEVRVGVDTLDAYEDLDFVSETVWLGEQPATMSTAGAFGTSDRLVVLSWTEPDLDDERCGSKSLVGTNVSREMMTEIAMTRSTPR